MTKWEIIPDAARNRTLSFQFQGHQREAATKKEKLVLKIF
jgi:hypothetical protein